MENDASMPYSPLTETRSLFNNPEMSDIRFLVEGQTVYGHKQILGMGSPVFKSMFFGQLKEQREVIEIKDLTLVGFKNALRYIYGFKIDFELTELCESYMAADKYLLNLFSQAFISYVQRKLNAQNGLLIYEQLMKIGEREEISLANLRSTIILNCQEMIKTKHFEQIDQKTLIHVLSLDELRIAEIDLLAAVSKWTSREVQRQGLPVNRENRRKVFEPIKGYILFTALTPEQIANCEDVALLLTDEESGSLLLHLLNKNRPSIIECKTPRKTQSGVCSVFVEKTYPVVVPNCLGWTKFTVNRRVSIQTIYTTFSERARDPLLKIMRLSYADLGLKVQSFVKDGKWCFSFESPFVMEANASCILKFSVTGGMAGEVTLSQQFQLNYKGWISFDLVDLINSTSHCIRGLDFSL